MFISKIKEAKKKTTFDTPIDQLKTPDILSRIDSPIATVEPDSTAEPGSTAEPEKKEFKKASQSDTLRATANMTPSDRMRDLMSRMRDLEGDEDDQGYPEPSREVSVEVTTENLPVVISKALSTDSIMTPTFHQVANLPGNMSRGIRQMGKQLFRIFTTTPTDDIYMIGNLGGMGPNTAREVNAVAGYLRNNGVDLGIGDIDFNDIIPGYRADIYQYSANGVRWLLVKDEFGQYIYTWPENTSVQHRNVKQLGTDIVNEGLLQKLGTLALSAALALGPQFSKAETVYSYMPANSAEMKSEVDYNKIPKDAKVVFEVDSETQQVKIIKGENQVSQTTNPQQLYREKMSKAWKIYKNLQQQSNMIDSSDEEVQNALRDMNANNPFKTTHMGLTQIAPIKHSSDPKDIQMVDNFIQAYEKLDQKMKKISPTVSSTSSINQQQSELQSSSTQEKNQLSTNAFSVKGIRFGMPIEEVQKLLSVEAKIQTQKGGSFRGGSQGGINTLFGLKLVQSDQNFIKTKLPSPIGSVSDAYFVFNNNQLQSIHFIIKFKDTGYNIVSSTAKWPKVPNILITFQEMVELVRDLAKKQTETLGSPIGKIERKKIDVEASAGRQFAAGLILAEPAPIETWQVEFSNGYLNIVCNTPNNGKNFNPEEVIISIGKPQEVDMAIK